MTFEQLITEFTCDKYVVGDINYQGQSFNVYRGCAVARVFMDTDGFIIVLDLTRQGVVYNWDIYGEDNYESMVSDCMARW